MTKTRSIISNIYLWYLALFMNRGKARLIRVIPGAISCMLACGAQAEAEEPKKQGIFKRAKGTFAGKVQIPIISSPVRGAHIPRGAKVAVAQIAGQCSEQVTDAISQHLVDHSSYSIVTRDRVSDIINENIFSRSGSIDTTTANELGRLLGASVFLYGRVTHCSIQSFRGAKKRNPLLTWLSKTVASTTTARVFVIIYVIDLTTGEKIFSSSHEGMYGENSLLLLAEAAGDELSLSGEDYFKMKAAADAASDFMSRILSRIEVLRVDMHSGPAWGLDKGVRYVRLGDCPKAERYFAEVSKVYATQENDKALSKIVYNHGVALMCANRPRDAIEKFIASYRLWEDESTMKLVKRCYSIIERDVEFWIETDPIIRDVIELPKKRKKR